MYDNKPIVTLIDIESSPLMMYAWGAYEQNALKILEPTKIIACAWKTLGENDAVVKTLADYKGYKPGVVDDEKLVRDVWKVLDRSDVVLGHNLDRFDIRKLNTRFAVYNLDAPSYYKTIDTLKVAKKMFAFDNNNLDYLGDLLQEGRKIDNGGFKLWSECMKGDRASWKKMAEYNLQDILLLERIYLRLRKHMDNHVNLNVIANPEAKDLLTCPTCLSDDIQKRGWSITRTGRKQRYQCNDCGSWSSGPHKKANVVLR